MCTAQRLAGLDQLEPRSWQHPAYPETQIGDLLAKFLCADRVQQEGFDKFEKDSDVRRSAYRFLHSSDDKGFVSLDIDLDQIDGEAVGQIVIDRDHVEFDRMLVRA